ncbi:MAG: HNH endonuclease [Anaerolineae bacterium]
MTTDYLRRFAKLRTDTSPARWPAVTCHRAPHKPFLLLALIDLIAQGVIQTNFIEFKADLIDIFDLYWVKTMGRQKPSNPVLPFFHMHREGFWHLVPVPGKEQVLANIPQIRSIGPLREFVLGATLDDALFEMLLNKETRDDLRRVLIETYFAPEVRPKLVELGQISAESFQYSLELLGRSKGRFRLKLRELPDEEERYQAVSRSTAFRSVVMKAYDYTCAMCRIRVFTPEGRSPVVAAHIVPWSESHNDDPRNGMALCGLHHWTFDQGLVSVTTGHRIQVSPAVPSDEPGTEPIVSLAERELHLPIEHTLWPAKTALKWHRENIFCAEVPPRLL